MQKPLNNGGRSQPKSTLEKYRHLCWNWFVQKEKCTMCDSKANNNNREQGFENDMQKSCIRKSLLWIIIIGRNMRGYIIRQTSMLQENYYYFYYYRKYKRKFQRHCNLQIILRRWFFSRLNEIPNKLFFLHNFENKNATR